jgi:hypothetical protein
VEEKLVKRDNNRLDNAGKKRRKRSLSVLELTDGLESGREPVHTSQITRHTPPAVEMSETVLSLPPSVADWNMSDIFNLSGPRYSLRGNPLPSLRTSESVPPVPNSTGYLQMPPNSLGCQGNQTRSAENSPAPPTGVKQRLDSLQDIAAET